MPNDTPWDPVAYGPVAWKTRKRPVLPAKDATHNQRMEQLKFDVLYAGAFSTGHWEDEWPLMTEEDFSLALLKVSQLELGGHFPDGKHPRAE